MAPATVEPARPRVENTCEPYRMAIWADDEEPCKTWEEKK
jgi:hypothetical protein